MKINSITFCNTIAHLLYNNGIRNVCISPGLRNTAISLSFIKHGKFTCDSILDERSAAYFAIGMSLKTNTASVLICTSGTATANYLPAIIEASQSKIPLIIITADRPSSLLNTGENQTINQYNIYGDFVRKSLDINLKEDSINIINDSLKFINTKNNHLTIGPIHFNIHLNDFNTSDISKTYKKLPIPSSNKLKENTPEFDWNDFPYQDVFNIYNYERPLIIIGRLNKKLNNKLITNLSRHLKAPILADSLSQIRYGNDNVLGLFEHYIDNENINPDLVIRIGQKPVSKKLCEKLTEWKNKTLGRLEFSSILIDESGRFNDDSPTVIQINYKQFIHAIIENTKKNENSDFYDLITSLDKKIAKIIQNEKDWSELTISKSVISSIASDENFVIGNSMPIRYVDMLGKYPNNINTYSNRGASGIDGIIATALGISKTSKKKTSLLIGDLSFIYDQNSLLIAKQLKINLTIIVINNNGGGIFKLLPVSKKINTKTFDNYWTTSHNLDLKKIANLYQSSYHKVSSIKQLENVLINPKNILGVNIIDAQVDIKNNKKILDNFKKKIKKG